MATLTTDCLGRDAVAPGGRPVAFAHISSRHDPADAADRPRPLRTEPRPLWFHVLVDGLIGFAATALVLVFFGEPLWVMILVGWFIGLVAAPFTRRIDERQLAERAAEGDAPA